MKSYCLGPQLLSNYAFLHYISMKSHCLGPQLLSDYAFLHYNYKYDWLRPTLEEIVDT